MLPLQCSATRQTSLTLCVHADRRTASEWCLPVVVQAINNFCKEMGVTRSDNVIHLHKLEHHVRAVRSTAVIAQSTVMAWRSSADDTSRRSLGGRLTGSDVHVYFLTLQRRQLWGAWHSLGPLPLDILFQLAMRKCCAGAGGLGGARAAGAGGGAAASRRHLQSAARPCGDRPGQGATPPAYITSAGSVSRTTLSNADGLWSAPSVAVLCFGLVH